jgi:aryl-alcohol dehydrogenase-like predicted oxidoreductase
MRRRRDKHLKKVQLGRTSEQVSEVCLGTMIMGSTIDEPTSFAMLDRFMELGGDFLDTANCYAWWIGRGEFVGDESEELLGRWMKARGNRQQLFLATKVGGRLRDVASIRDANGDVYWDRVDGDHERQTATTIRAAVEDSLRRLQTDHIDLYYSHLDDRETQLEERLKVLNDLVVAGKVRHLGASNYRAWRLERARSISAANGWAAFVAIQQQSSYLRPKQGADFGTAVNFDSELADYLLANPEVALLAYSPLLKGIYEDEAKRKAYYNWSQFDSDDARSRLTTLTALAADLHVTNSQLVLAWLLNREPATIPIITGSGLAQLEHNLGAVEIALTPEQVATLDAAGS